MDLLPAKRRRKNMNYGQQPKRCWPFFMRHGGPKDFFDTIRGEAVDKEVDSPQR